MTPGTIAQLLRDYGATGVSALCICAMVSMFFRLGAAQERLVAELNLARERETAALRTVLPVVEKMLVAISVKEKRRRLPEDTNPGIPNPLTVTK